MNGTLGAIGFGIGLFWGSFNTVLVPRLHSGKKGIIAGRSECDHCHRTLTAFELIPVLSFCLQKGSCASCRKPIARWIPLFEMTSAVSLMTISIWHGVPDLEWARALWAGMIFLSITLSDLLYFEVHDSITLSGIAGLLLLHMIDGTWPKALAGLGVATLFFGVQWWMTRGKGIGSGDIGIGMIMGLFLRWPIIVGGLLIAYVSASSFALVQMALGKAHLKSRIPLGPFLAIGTMIAWGLHAEILRWINPSI